jgi:hypothetical protein
MEGLNQWVPKLSFRGSDGEDALSGYLTNETHTITAYSYADGKISDDLPKAGGAFKVMSGRTDVTQNSGTSFDLVLNEGETATAFTDGSNGSGNYISREKVGGTGLRFKLYTSGNYKGKYVLEEDSSGSWKTDSATFDIQASYGSATITKTYTIVKSKSSSILSIRPSSYFFGLAPDGEAKTVTDAITFRANKDSLKPVVGAKVSWKVFGVDGIGDSFLLEELTQSGNGQYLSILPTNADLTVAKMTVSQFVSIRSLNDEEYEAVKVTATFDGVTDECTITPTFDGVDGDDGKDAISGYLTNESHSITAYSYADGKISDDLGTAGGKFEVLDGLSNVTNDSGTSFDIVTADGETVSEFTDSPNGSGKSISRGLTGGSGLKLKFYTSGSYKGRYFIEEDAADSWKTDSVAFDLKATRLGVDLVKTYTIVKSKSSSILSLRPTAFNFNLKQDKTPQNASDKISFSVVKDSLKPIEGAKVTWKVFGVSAGNEQLLETLTSAGEGNYLNVLSSPSDLQRAEMPVSKFTSIRTLAENYTHCKIEASFDGVSDVVTITPAFDGAKGDPGDDAVVGYLTNESFTITAYSYADGKISDDLPEAGGKFNIMSGVTNVSSESGTVYEIVTNAGESTGTFTDGANGGGVTLSRGLTGGSGLKLKLYTSGLLKGKYVLEEDTAGSWKTDLVTFDLKATFSGTSVTKTYSINKSKSSSILSVKPTSLIFALKSNGTAQNSGDQIEFRAIKDSLKPIAGAKVTWDVFGVKSDGTTSASALESLSSATTGNSLTVKSSPTDLSVAIMGVEQFRHVLSQGSPKYIGAQVKATYDGVTDTVTINSVFDGAKGDTGTNALSGYLTNEAHTITAYSYADGKISDDLGLAGGKFNVLDGISDVTSDAGTTFDIVTAVGESTSPFSNSNGSGVSLSRGLKNGSGLKLSLYMAGAYKGRYVLEEDSAGSWKTDSVVFDLKATRSGTSITKSYTIVKSKSSSVLFVRPTSFIFNLKSDGTAQSSGDKIKIKAIKDSLKPIDGAKVVWEVWGVKSDGTVSATALASMSSASTGTYLTVNASPSDLSEAEISIEQFRSVRNFNVTPKYVSCLIKATYDGVSDGVTISAAVDGAKGDTGTAALSGYLTNETFAITAYSYADGKISDDLPKAGGKFSVLSGTTDVSTDAGTVYDILLAAGETTGTFTDGSNGSGKTLSRGLTNGKGLKLKLYTTGNYKGKYVLEEDESNSWKTDSVTFELTATYSGATIIKSYVISKVKSVSVLTLRPSSFTFNLKSDGTEQNSGDKIIFRAIKDSLKPIVGAKVSWEVRGMFADGTTESIATITNSGNSDYLNVPSANADLSIAEMQVSQFKSIRGIVGKNYTAAQVKATYDGVTDTVTVSAAFDGAKGDPGNDAITGYLTNESCTIPALSHDSGKLVASAISGGLIAAAGGNFKVVLGVTDITANASTSFNIIDDSDTTDVISNADNKTLTKNGLLFKIYTSGANKGKYELSQSTKWTSSAETFTVTATYNGSTITKLFTISKNFSGSLISLNPNSFVFNLASDGSAKNGGDKIKFTAKIGTVKLGVLNGTVKWKVYGVDANDAAELIETKITGTSGTYINVLASPDDLTVAEMSVTQFRSARSYIGKSYVAVRVEALFDSDAVSDAVTIYAALDGAKGDTGTAALSGYLTNEAHVITAYSYADGKISDDLGSAGGKFNVLSGTTDVTTDAGTAFDIETLVGETTGTFTDGANGSGKTLSRGLISGSGLKLKLYTSGNYKGKYVLEEDSAGSWKTDSVTFSLTATRSGASISKTYTITKVKSNSVLTLRPTSLFFNLKSSGDAQNSGDKIGFRAIKDSLKPIANSKVTWEVWGVKSDGTLSASYIVSMNSAAVGTYLTVKSTPTDLSEAEMTVTQFRSIRSYVASPNNYVSCVVKATYDGVTDSTTITPTFDGVAGSDSVVGYLTNESSTIPALSHDDGKLVASAISGGLITAAGGFFKVVSGITDVTSNANTSFAVIDDSDAATLDTSVAGKTSFTKNGLKLTLYTSGADKGKYELSQNTKWTSAAETFTLTGTYNGVVVTKIVSISKSFSGSMIILTPSSFVFNLTSAGAAKNSGDSIKFTAKTGSAKLGVSGGTVKWKLWGIRTTGEDLLETRTISGNGTYISVNSSPTDLSVANLAIAKFVTIRGLTPAAASSEKYTSVRMEALFDNDLVTDDVTINAAIDGAAGAAGNTVLQGSGAPSAGTGNDGDTYLDTTNHVIYKKSSGSWASQGSSFKGVKGDTGLTGAAMLQGAGAPASGTGANGDVYVDTTNHIIYKKASGSWSSQGSSFKGVKGDTGLAGAAMLQGSNAPASGTGNDGDTYVDTTNHIIYKKASGSWSSQGSSFKGAKGDTGLTGPQGIQGLQGTQGLQGLTGAGVETLSREKGQLVNGSWSPESQTISKDEAQGWDVILFQTAVKDVGDIARYANTSAEATLYGITKVGYIKFLEAGRYKIEFCVYAKAESGTGLTYPAILYLSVYLRNSSGTYIKRIPGEYFDYEVTDNDVPYELSSTSTAKRIKFSLNPVSIKANEQISFHATGGGTQSDSRANPIIVGASKSSSDEDTFFIITKV